MPKLNRIAIFQFFSYIRVKENCNGVREIITNIHKRLKGGRHTRHICMQYLNAHICQTTFGLFETYFMHNHTPSSHHLSSSSPSSEGGLFKFCICNSCKTSGCCTILETKGGGFFEPWPSIASELTTSALSTGFSLCFVSLP